MNEVLSWLLKRYLKAERPYGELDNSLLSRFEPDVELTFKLRCSRLLQLTLAQDVRLSLPCLTSSST